MKKQIILFRLLSFSGFLIGSLHAGERAERAFWTPKDQHVESQKSENPPMQSWVEAGPVAHGNVGGSAKDEWTGALRVEASFRDWSEYFRLRIDGLLGIGGPAEGLAEAQVVLFKGFSFGAGLSYTDRIKNSGRCGLYVEDKTNTRRRGGIYLLTHKGAGLEMSWPVVERWAAWGDIGTEDDHGDQYQRATLGLLYSF